LNLGRFWPGFSNFLSSPSEPNASHAVPGVEHIDHVNLVVADMGAMIAFYCDVLGMKLARQVTIGGPWIDEVTALADVMADVAFLEAPSGPRIELLYYHRPQAERVDGLGVPNVLGLRHIAFRVSDIEQVVAAIRAAGVPLVSEIHSVPTAQVAFGRARKRLVYFRDPEGNLLELCAYE
jgi:catechol 2,3-dioxygenase-like lactoylglutathione lyase family enzyme